MSQDFGSQRLQQFPGREEARKCTLPTPESSENNANAMPWAKTSACCMTLRHLYADIFKSRSLRGAETWRDIRKHEVALERKRDWRHAHGQRSFMLHGCSPYPCSPQATHARAGTPCRAGKKAGGCKELSVLVCYWRKWGKNIFVKWQRQGTGDHVVSAPFSFQSDIHFQLWEDTNPSSPSCQPQSPYLCFREASSTKLWPSPKTIRKELCAPFDGMLVCWQCQRLALCHSHLQMLFSYKNQDTPFLVIYWWGIHTLWLQSRGRLGDTCPRRPGSLWTGDRATDLDLGAFKV